MTPAQRWIAYVGPVQYPWGQASSRRVDGIARSLALAGHHVIVAGGELQPPRATVLPDVEGPGSISYLGLGELPVPGASLLTKSVQTLLAWGRRTVAWLDAQARKPSHVILYGGGTPYAEHLRRWCRDNQVPLVVDVVEWYSPRQFAGGFFGPYYLGSQVALRHHYPRCSGLITISSYLADYYRHKGCPVVQVPPTLDVRRLPAEETPGRRASGVTSLVYAGSPGKKDLLGSVVAAVDEVARTGGAVRLRVLGASPEQVRALFGASLPESVEVLGRVPQQDVAGVLREADFTVLLRPPARYATAGFPTKFCESLANGTPVIANLTSDLGRHLHDGVEGLVCADHSVEALVAALRQAAVLSDEEKAMMRKAARVQALASFDFRAYAAPLSDLLEAVRP